MRFIDMFCGIGGFRRGLEKASTQPHEGQYKATNTRSQDCVDLKRNRKQASYQCVWSNDNDKYACQIYRRHFGEVYEGDIRTVGTDAIPEHDLLCAGFPCQSFSIAGKRRGFKDTRGTLFFEICRVLRAKRPRMLFLENVKGLLSADEGQTFLTILQSLDELGYDCQWQVLNSKDYGVPQNRERVFIIGHTRGQPRPKVFPLGEADEVYSESDEQLAHAIDSNYHKGWLDNQQRTMIQLGLVGEKDGMGQRIYDSDDLASSLRGEGGGQGGKTGLYAVLTPDRPKKRQHDRRFKENGEPSFTLTEQDIHGISNGLRIRRLTPIECERLQGFPDNWTKGISDSQRYKCLGNTVTVNVIEAIGRQLMEFKQE